MSDDEKSNAGSEAAKSEEEEPQPPVLVKKEQLVAGLSRIERTHGKFFSLSILKQWLTYYCLLLRWNIVRILNIDNGGDRPCCG